MANTPDPPENYSFVVSSDATVSADSSSILEHHNMLKQKRRRTSPRDHAILEAAYLRNSKPDKHERADIVSQVELGEKEVQIWFQNRRQNDRRKSKPLQPHELLAHFRNGTPIQVVKKGNVGEEEKATANDSVVNPGLEVPRPSSRSSSIHELLNPTSSAEPISARVENSNKPKPTPNPSEILPTPPSSFDPTERPEGVVGVHPAIRSQHARHDSGMHSRKRSHEVMVNESSSKPSASTIEGIYTSSQPRMLSRSSSFVRLAMTVDGAVKVRTNNEPTPSPPKQRPPPPGVPARKRESLGRSQSAVENGFVFRDVNGPVRKIGGAGFGRSRDARTWEFYCDRDSGNALSKQAEAERNGSAVGAINLIRSRSQRNKSSALSPNLTKQNGRRVRVDTQSGKPKLTRAMSSMACLQSFDGAVEVSEGDNKRTKHERSPSGDSDKENWAPGTRTSRHTLRRMHASAPRNSVLQENDFPSARDLTRSAVSQGQENRDLAGKDKAKGDDLDCIQGLLSLSQGAWR